MSSLFTHTTFQRMRRMRLGVVVWLMFCMTAAFASPLVQPMRYEVICGAHGKAQLITHDASPFGSDSKARAKSAHAIDCVLCAIHLLAPPPAHAPQVMHKGALREQHMPDSSSVVTSSTTSPPARGPPSYVHFSVNSPQRGRYEPRKN